MFQVRNLKTKKCDYSWYVKLCSLLMIHNKVIVVTSHGILSTSYEYDVTILEIFYWASHVYKWYNYSSGSSFWSLAYIPKQLKTAHRKGLWIDCISIKLQICACTIVQWTIHPWIKSLLGLGEVIHSAGFLMNVVGKQEMHAWGNNFKMSAVRMRSRKKIPWVHSLWLWYHNTTSTKTFILLHPHPPTHLQQQMSHTFV